MDDEVMKEEMAAAGPRGLQGLRVSHTSTGSENYDGAMVRSNVRDQEDWDRENMTLYLVLLLCTTGAASSLGEKFKPHSGATGNDIAVWLVSKKVPT